MATLAVRSASPTRRRSDTTVRRCRRDDIPAISRLYYHTVHCINAIDYTPQQIAAWAPHIYDDAFWRQRFRAYRVFLAEQGGEVVGFAEFGQNGHLDCLYVRHDRQGCGVGSALLDHVLRAARRAGARQLHADVSTTARPFFRRRGFGVCRWQNKIYRNRCFRQFLMTRPIR